MINSIDDHLFSELTDDQKQAVKKFSSWLKKKIIGDPFVLSGHAGSGKTYLAMKFLELVDEQKLCWTVAAPTHKAVGVLRKALAKHRLKPTWYPSTIHRLLRLKLKRKGSIELCEETKQTMSSFDDLALVIIDESSMIDSNLLEITLKCAHLSGTRLVFVGDPAQLPPVGEMQSPVFSMNTSNISCLNEVVRHQGPILDLASSIRNGSIPCVIPPCLPSFKSSKGSFTCLKKKSWLDKAKASLKEASDNNNPDQARILCYTNRVLERLVPHARRAIHGEMADQMPVLPGEVLIARRPVMSSASVGIDDVCDETGMLISSNREMIVLDISYEDCDMTSFGFVGQINLSNLSINTLLVKVRCDEREFSFRLLPQVGTRSRENLDDTLKQISDIAKNSNSSERKKYWRLFFLIRDSFASLGPASVLTVHRSQGSTFDNVFVASDVFLPNDIALRKQLVYVAVSRASKHVWLIGDDLEFSYREKWEKKFKKYL